MWKHFRILFPNFFVPTVLCFSFFLLGTVSLQGQNEKSELPEGTNGIASKYNGDKGIQSDDRVVFCEQFEQKNMEKTMKRWESARGHKKGQLKLTGRTPDGSSGSRSLLMKHIGGKTSTVDLYRRLKNSDGEYGYEKLFMRMYVRFGSNCQPLHHFGTGIGGDNPPKPWPQMDAGNRPSGDESFNVSFEPFGKDWRWDFYVYWNEMRGSPPNGKTWGNSFIQDDRLTAEKGKWTCIEVMVKLNDTGDTNGELAAWVNGKKVSHLGKGFPKGTWVWDKFHPGKKGPGYKWEDGRTKVPGNKPFQGFRWRTSEELKITYIWPYVYITKAPEGHISRVWFDHIVVARNYIGPINEKE